MEHMIHIEDLAVWRHSKLDLSKLSIIFNHSCNDDRNIVLDVLQDSQVVSAIPTIDRSITLHSINKIAASLSKAKSFSDLSKRDQRYARYLYDLAISSLIRHDTGAKGRLSLVSLGNQTINYFEGMTKVILPGDFDENSDLSAYDAYNKNTDITSREKSSFLIESVEHDQYSFQIDFRRRLQLSQMQVQEARNMMDLVGSIIASKMQQVDEVEFFIPFSVDFMINNDIMMISEVHIPPRGIELQYYGFRPFFPSLEFPSDGILNYLLKYLSSIHSDPLIKFINPHPSIGFFVAEKEFLEKQAKNVLGVIISDDELHSGRLIANWFVEYPSNPISCHRNLLHVPPHRAMQFVDDRREFNESALQADLLIIPHIIVPPRTWINIDSIVNQFGEFVVCKEPVHRSWWHPNKRRVKLLNLNFTPLREYMHSEAWEGCIIESMLTNSVDSYSHHGELKIIGSVSSQGGKRHE